MNQLHFPWLELAIFLPAFGAMFANLFRSADSARRFSLMVSGGALLAAVGGWIDFSGLHTFEAHDRWDWTEALIDRDLFVVDELSAPLIPLVALQCFMTQLATLRSKMRRFSFAWALSSEAILLATISCKIPWLIVALLIAGTIPPYLELRRRLKATRLFVLHMGLFALLLVVGQSLAQSAEPGTTRMLVAMLCLAAAVLVRSGATPVHCWMPDLFEKAGFGTALMFVAPMIGAYACMRLVLPTAPQSVLRLISIVSLITAVYASGMALVQREARRFFCYLFLSYSSLVLVGLELATPIGLTGALSVWLSIGVSLTGFGLTLRAVESRTGMLSLTEFHGMYEQTPMLAGFFLLTGLASIGFPGTSGFVGGELLVEGAVQVSPFVGAAVVIASALNGLAILQVYFRIFTGTTRQGTIDLLARPPERIAVLTLSLLILLGGLYPQPGIRSRHHAAVELVLSRSRSLATSEERVDDSWNPLGKWEEGESSFHQIFRPRSEKETHGTHGNAHP